MDLYRWGSLLLDVSIGLLVVNVLVKAYFVWRFFRANGKKELTDSQKARIGKVSKPVIAACIVCGLASLVIFAITLSR